MAIHLDESSLALGILGRARVLYTDLDGTLLGRGGTLLADEDGRPYLGAAEAVAALNGEGLTVVPVSGRNARQLTEICRLCGWPDFIAEVGCVTVLERGTERIYNLGDWEPSSVPPGRTPHSMIDESGAVDLLMRRFPGFIEHHDPWHLDREATHVLRGGVDVSEAQRVLDGLPLPVSIFDNGVIHPWRHTLADDIEQIHAYHLLPRGVTKHQAIALDLERRGLGRGYAIACGDSATDLEMAESVALMVLVGNALDGDTVREAVGRYENVVITRGRKGRGWAELARAWLGARRQGA